MSSSIIQNCHSCARPLDAREVKECIKISRNKILKFVLAFFSIYAIVYLFRLTAGSSLRHWPPGTDSSNVRAVFFLLFQEYGDHKRRIVSGDLLASKIPPSHTYPPFERRSSKPPPQSVRASESRPYRFTPVNQVDKRRAAKTAQVERKTLI